MKNYVSRRAGWTGLSTVALLGLLLFPVPGRAGEGEGGGEPRTVRSRNRYTCQILISHAFQRPDSDKWVVDDTNGVPVAPLDLEAFRAFLATGPRITGKIILAGLPLWGPKKREFVRGIRELLDQNGHADIPIRVFTEPQGEGVDRAVQEFVYFLPRPSDIQPPIRRDYQNGVGLSTKANAAVFVWGLFREPLSKLLAMTGTNFSLDMVFGVFRTTINNWILRSENRVPEVMLKEMINSIPFVAGFYVSSQPREVLAHLRRSGLLDVARDFAVRDGAACAWNGVLFTVLFRGLSKWAQAREATPEGTEIIRNYFLVVMGDIFLITAPALAMASTSQIHPFPVPWLDWVNPGHLVLAGMAGLGTFAWRNPMIYDQAVPIVKDGVFLIPVRLLQKIAAALRRRGEASELVAGEPPGEFTP